MRGLNEFREDEGRGWDEGDYIVRLKDGEMDIVLELEAMSRCGAEAAFYETVDEIEERGGRASGELVRLEYDSLLHGYDEAEVIARVGGEA